MPGSACAVRTLRYYWGVGSNGIDRWVGCALRTIPRVHPPHGPVKGRHAKASVDSACAVRTLPADPGITRVSAALEEIGLSENVMDMNVIELPNAGTPAVLVAAAPVAGKELVMGFCLPTTIIDKTHQDPLGVTPNADARSYFWLYNKQQEVALPSFDSVRIVKQPAHGQLIREKNAAGRDVYVYRPSFGYLGKDRFEAVVPVGNDTVRIIYYIVVQKDLTDQDGFDSKNILISKNLPTGSSHEPCSI